MHLQFPPDATMDHKLEHYLSAISGNIALLIREFSAKYDPKYIHQLSLIEDGFKLLNETIAERKKLFGPNISLVVNQLDSILGIILKINRDISKNAPLDVFLREFNTLANNFDIYYIKEIKNIDYIYSEYLDDYDFKVLYNEIINRGCSIETDIPQEVFFNADKNSKTFILKNLIEIKNIITKPKTSEPYLEILLFTEQLKAITEVYNLNERTKDTNKAVSQNISNRIKENTSGLDEIYKNNANILDKKIDDLNKIILILFIIIIFFIVIKLGLTLFYYNEFTKIYNLIPFVSLIIACSALLTYLIKDRNRLIKLYTHYDMCHRELSTLPEYMRELDLDQRKKMYIDLSINYFRGGNLNNEATTNNKSEIETIKTSISDLAKIVSEIKGVVK